MNTAQLPPMLAYWGIAVSLLLLALMWLLWRIRTRLNYQQSKLAKVEQVRVSLSAQSEHTRALRVVIKRHLLQSLTMRSQMQTLQSRYRDMQNYLLQANAFARARRLIRKGNTLEPMVRRGEINAAEAHLIEILDRPKPKQSA